MLRKLSGANTLRTVIQTSVEKQGYDRRGEGDQRTVAGEARRRKEEEKQRERERERESAGLTGPPG